MNVSDLLAAMLERADATPVCTEAALEKLQEVCTDLPRVVRALQRVWPILNERQQAIITEELSRE